LPRNLVWATLDPETAARRGVAADASSELLVIAHRNVLNTTELYRRLTLSDTQMTELHTLEQLLVDARRARLRSTHP